MLRPQIRVSCPALPAGLTGGCEALVEGQLLGFVGVCATTNIRGWKGGEWRANFPQRGGAVRQLTRAVSPEK